MQLIIRYGTGSSRTVPIDMSAASSNVTQSVAGHALDTAQSNASYLGLPRLKTSNYGMPNVDFGNDSDSPAVYIPSFTYLAAHSGVRETFAP